MRNFDLTTVYSAIKIMEIVRGFSVINWTDLFKIDLNLIEKLRFEISSNDNNVDINFETSLNITISLIRITINSMITSNFECKFFFRIFFTFLFTFNIRGLSLRNSNFLPFLSLF